MSNDRSTRATMPIVEATVSNMLEIVAIVELLEQKGLCTKQNLHTIIESYDGKIPVPASLRRHSLSRTCLPKPKTRSSTTFSNCSTRMAMRRDQVGWYQGYRVEPIRSA
jgi:hypothetical protein